jgi:hypothetical protein
MNLFMNSTFVPSGPRGEQAPGLRQPLRGDGLRLKHSTPSRPLSSLGAMIFGAMVERRALPLPSYRSVRL